MARWNPNRKALPMFEDSFPLAGLKAGLTLLVIVVVFGFLILDARRNRPDRRPED